MDKPSKLKNTELAMLQLMEVQTHLDLLASVNHPPKSEELEEMAKKLDLSIRVFSALIREGRELFEHGPQIL